MTMAKKFWEREDFDIAMFAAVFNGVYGVLYETCDYGPGYRSMLERGDRLLQDKGAAPVVKLFNEHRQDYVSSDREAAAFAVTYGIYERYNELHE